MLVAVHLYYLHSTAEGPTRVYWLFHKLVLEPFVQITAVEAEVVSQSFVFKQNSSECLQDAITHSTIPEIESLLANEYRH
jgi:hypothetical protein